MINKFLYKSRFNITSDYLYTFKMSCYIYQDFLYYREFTKQSLKQLVKLWAKTGIY
jgi:hypothetical protein